MSKLWTVISVDRESGSTKNHTITTGFDVHVAESKFREDYPDEDMLALISGMSDVRVYDGLGHNRDPEATRSADVVAES